MIVLKLPNLGLWIEPAGFPFFKTEPEKKWKMNKSSGFS
jgi:hypothetical protein